MTETVRKRRRWPWAFLAVGLVLVAACLGWHFRPLTPAERKLVGRWETAIVSELYEFRSDRVLLIDGRPTATWSASEHSLTIRSSVLPFRYSSRSWPVRVGKRIQQLLLPNTRSATWEGPDRLLVGGVIEFNRVPDSVSAVADRPVSP